MLVIEHLCKSFGGLKAVNDVSFSIEPRKITALIGPNGAGKTTLINLITGLLRPDSGHVCHNGIPIDCLPVHEIVKLGVARTLQDPKNFETMTALENILIGMPHQHGENIFVATLRRNRMLKEEAQNKAAAIKLLDRVGLYEKASEFAGALSFGDQRLLSLARTLATQPQLLLLDEPTVGLDPASLGKMSALLVDLVVKEAKTIVLVEHNMEIVMNISNWVIVLVEGRVISAGEPRDVKKDPRVLRAYLGEPHA